jgi:hypothetical protein
VGEAPEHRQEVGAREAQLQEGSEQGEGQGTLMETTFQWLVVIELLVIIVLLIAPRVGR